MKIAILLSVMGLVVFSAQGVLCADPQHKLHRASHEREMHGHSDF